MAPPATLGALFIVLALVPGWTYLRLVERLQPPRSASGLHELLEVLAVGAATTGVSTLALLLLPHHLLPFTLNIDTWAAGGSHYLRAHTRAAAASAALIFAGALLLALGMYWMRARRKPDEFRAQGNVWVHSLGNRPAGKIPYVGLHLEDGRLVEGPLHSYTLSDESSSSRDIALAGPIRITQEGETEPRALHHPDRLIVDASRIAFITVIHAPAKHTERSRWRGLLRISPRGQTAVEIGPEHRQQGECIETGTLIQQTQS